MMMNKGVSAVCKRCGRSSPAEQFILDPIYGMMVCQLCVKERKGKSAAAQIKQDRNAVQQKKEEEVRNRPPGWDKEDEYLERSYAKKRESQVGVERIDGSHVNYSCPKCKYRFIYDTERKHPKVCPYCNSQIFSMKF
jgi:DNA-directed RNA polymerase subunit RPC12/RpoP